MIEPDTPVLILASASPRRRELIGRLGLPHEVAVPSVDEAPLPGEAAEASARRVARSKARAIAARRASGIVIGADTIVVLDGAALGKPQDDAEAHAMLRELRGRRHDVITGVAVLDARGSGEQISSTTTCVGMRDYSDEEIAAYVASGDAQDKAGAYAVQNAAFHPAATIVGCYANVVGLPLCAVADSLGRFGITARCPVAVEGACFCRSCLGAYRPLNTGGRRS